MENEWKTTLTMTVDIVVNALLLPLNLVLVLVLQTCSSYHLVQGKATKPHCLTRKVKQCAT